MLSNLPPIAAIVRTETQPRQYPVWIVGGELFYTADEAVSAAQDSANRTKDVIRVFFRLTRSSELDTWQRVEPQTTSSDDKASGPLQFCLSSRLQPEDATGPIQQVDFKSVRQARERKNNRDSTKRWLMELDAHCTGCREELGKGNCHMAADHLFCSWCINLVRQKKRPVQLAIIATMKRKLAKRDAIEAGLKSEVRPAVVNVASGVEVPEFDIDRICKPR